MTDYIEKTKNNPPRPLLVKALEFIQHKNNALDLGAGAFVDTKYLLKEDFKHVVALDRSALALEIYENLPKDKVDYTISTFANYDFPVETFDLINAQFSLPFNPPDSFTVMFEKLSRALATGGIFTGQFFGDRDEWNTPESGMTFHSLAAVKKLLADLETIYFEEEEKDEKPVIGAMKHWHIFHVIARRK